MNKSKLATLVLFIALAYPTSVSAVDTVVTPSLKPNLIRENRREVKENVREIRQDVREDKKEIKATGVQDRNSLRRKLMTTSQTGLLKSFTVRATALEKYQSLISDRITKKQAKLSANNPNLIDAQKRLAGDELKTLWSNYSTGLSTYETSIKNIESSTDLKVTFNELRTQAKKVNENIKAIRKYLVDTLRLVVKAK